MLCTHCQKETTNAKFCSRSCSASHNNHKNPKRKLDRVCSHEDCGEQVKSYRHRLCTEHHEIRMDGLYKDKTIGEYRNHLSVQGKHASYTHAHVRRFCRNWNKNLTTKPCHNCGYDKHVELCHIKAVSSFDDNTTLREVNDPKNVIQLCRNCHWEFDNNLLVLDLERH